MAGESLSTDEWLPFAGVFVPGKPLTDIWAAAGLCWRDTLAAHVRGPIRHPRLSFTRRDRAWFDLDNLVYPVLAVSGTAACDSVWATVEEGTGEGVLIRSGAPPAPPEGAGTMRVRIASPSRSSVRNRPPVPELVTATAFGDDGPLGMAVAFDDADVPVGELSFEGPIKSLVDDLTPLFGERMISGRLMAKDYRVRELRITRGHSPGEGCVTVTLWHLPTSGAAQGRVDADLDRLS